MKLDIHIGIVAYNLTDEFEKLLQSCLSKQGHDVTVHVFDHSPHARVNEVCARWNDRLFTDGGDYPTLVRVHSHKRNRGLSVGWNDAILAAYGDNDTDDSNRVLILVNDDVEFDAAPIPTDPEQFFNDYDADVRIGWTDDGKSDIDRLAEYAHSRRDLYMITVLGYNRFYVDNPSRHPQHPERLAGPWVGIGFSCFALNPVFLRTVGMFDENIVPIYYEDCDAGERAHRLGLQMGELKQTRVLHYGSLSWRFDPERHHQQTTKTSPAIERYFLQKWGGLPGNLWCKTPEGKDLPIHAFPFGDPSFNLYIAPTDKAHPYGPLYDRYDIADTVLDSLGDKGKQQERWERALEGAETEFKSYNGHAPQLVINGDPMPHAYIPPSVDRWPFRPGAGGNSIWSHMERLADIASRAAVIVEVGIATMTGSTHAFELGLQASPAAKGRKRHIGVDIHEAISGPWVPQSDWWQFVSGDSRSAGTVCRVRNLLTVDTDGGGSEFLTPDILYIDTMHEYPQLKAELAVWKALVGPNTLLLFHDTHMGGQYNSMTDAIRELEASDLAASHRYVQISTECEGLGALVPVGGWKGVS